VLLYSQFGDKNVININQLGLDWKIRYGAIVDNVVTYMYVYAISAATATTTTKVIAIINLLLLLLLLL